jgi:hypothetical protein
MMMEATLWIPIMALLIVGMIQVGKITYLYYSLKKSVYAAARYLSVQQGVNFCDPANDPSVAAAFQFAVTGTADGSGTPLISNFTTDMLQVTPECVDAASGVPGPCDTSACPTIMLKPDYIVVNMPGGYQVQPRIPFITLLPISLAPSIMVPFGGTT